MASSVPREHRKTTREIFSLHEMFRVVGDQLTARDVKVLKCLYNSTLSEEMKVKITDGYTFLLALERLGRVDDSNFRHLTRLLRIISRMDLIQFVSLKRRKTVSPDPVDEFLERTAKSRVIIPFKRKHLDSNSTDCKTDLASESESQSEPVAPTGANRFQPELAGEDDPEPGTSGLGAEHPVSNSAVSVSKRGNSDPVQDISEPHSKKRKTEKRKKSGSVSTATSSSTGLATLKSENAKEEIKRKVTCDIRLRVRAEYCNHEAALQGNIHSNKPELLERQFERFFQANTILKSRDLGSIICDIKFSELTYLDAFWRDYINGSLLEALKGVFITDSLKQAVGHEAIKLLVNVDEDDYVAGRIKLLQNLKD